MKQRSFEQLNQVVGNNRTVYENVLNGYKAWQTRKQKLIEKAVNRGINVDSLFCKYQQAVEIWESDFSKFGIIAKEIQFIRKTCFERWGDRNYIDRNIASWFSSQVAPLDVLVQELNEMYFSNIEPVDVIEFIVSYPNRNNYPALAELRNREIKFKNKVGFNPKEYEKQSIESNEINVPF